MNEQAINQFSIAPYLNLEAQDFLLYDWGVVMVIPLNGINANNRLGTKGSTIVRTLDSSKDYAGIGITSGSVVMGGLGPKNQGKGVKKFGILGDPLNLAAIIEDLTRFFNAEIILTEELVFDAQKAEFKVRRLGRMRVKGRIDSVTIFALGYANDPRSSDDNIQ